MRKQRNIRDITDLEEAEIQKEIAGDPDAPEATDDQIARAKSFAEALPELAAAFQKNLGGRPKADNPKVSISIRLDREVVDRFKASGDGWQSRMNETLRRSVGL